MAIYDKKISVLFCLYLEEIIVQVSTHDKFTAIKRTPEKVISWLHKRPFCPLYFLTLSLKLFLQKH